MKHAMAQTVSSPVFAVVGHPNKGKSSLVANLAQDDSVRIAADPGTTVRARHFPMRVDGEVLYTLVDTPGFQRARGALGWMQAHASSASDRAAAVALFVNEHRDGGQFPDECELLAPIVEGAGILYVVDGSVPYAREYEPEMEILRWTGRPSMATINPIGDADYVAQWRDALGQYFKVVRVFDALTAPFDKRLQLLRAFGELEEPWRAPLARAVDALEADRNHRRGEAARAMVELIVEATTLSVECKLGEGEAAPSRKPDLERRYQEGLRSAERRCRTRVEQIYDHHGIERREQHLEPLEEDLFSEHTWFMFGLSRASLTRAAAAGGAVVGGGLDLAVGGASLLMGAALGAVVGGTLGWFSADKLAAFTVINQPLGGRLLRCGPTPNPNLAFVLLGRARYHHAAIAGRTHAQRDALQMDGDAGGAGALNPLADGQRDALSAAFRKIRKSEGDPAKLGGASDDLYHAIDGILAGDETRAPA
jgi:hypothetical protein